MVSTSYIIALFLLAHMTHVPTAAQTTNIIVGRYFNRVATYMSCTSKIFCTRTPLQGS